MNLVRKRWLTTLLLPGSALALTLPASAQAPVYALTDLGLLGFSTQGNALNSQGQAVGYFATGGLDATGKPAFRAFFNGGSSAVLGTLGGSTSVATGINGSGQIVGYAMLPGDVEDRAFLESGGGALVNLGTLIGGLGDTSAGLNSSAAAINAGGEVVGSSSAAGPSAGSTVLHGFVYTASAGMADLGTLGGSNSQANGLNAQGQIVGNSSTLGDAATHSYVWVPASPGGTTGAMIDIGALGGAYNTAAAINSAGRIVGLFTTTSGDIHAYRNVAALTPINPLTDDLGTLGGTYSSATAINTVGTTVGFSSTAGGNVDAFVSFSGSGGLIDLNTLMDPITGSGWTLIAADGINDQGQIVGYGTLNGQTQAFLLTPTPEPSVLAVLASGAAGVGMLIARKRRLRRTA